MRRQEGGEEKERKRRKGEEGRRGGGSGLRLRASLAADILAWAVPCRRAVPCFTSDFPIIKRQSVSTMRRKIKYHPGDFYFQSVFLPAFMCCVMDQNVT